MKNLKFYLLFSCLLACLLACENDLNTSNQNYAVVPNQDASKEDQDASKEDQDASKEDQDASKEDQDASKEDDLSSFEEMALTIPQSDLFSLLSIRGSFLFAGELSRTIFKSLLCINSLIEDKIVIVSYGLSEITKRTIDQVNKSKFHLESIRDLFTNFSSQDYIRKEFKSVRSDVRGTDAGGYDGPIIHSSYQEYLYKHITLLEKNKKGGKNLECDKEIYKNLKETIEENIENPNFLNFMFSPYLGMVNSYILFFDSFLDKMRKEDPLESLLEKVSSEKESLEEEYGFSYVNENPDSFYEAMSRLVDYHQNSIIQRLICEGNMTKDICENGIELMRKKLKTPEEREKDQTEYQRKKHLLKEAKKRALRVDDK